MPGSVAERIFDSDRFVSAGAAEFVHTAGLYEGDHGLLPLVVTFVDAGVAAGEPVVIALSGEHADMVRSVLPASPAFYAGARDVQQLVDFVAGKALDAIGVPHTLYTRWTGELGAGRAVEGALGA